MLQLAGLRPRSDQTPQAEACATKTCYETTPEMGRAAGGGPAARGAWANSMWMRSSRGYRDRGLSAEPIKHKKTSTASTEMKTAGITSVLDPRVRALLEARKFRE
jgi:hypothetical protein